MRNRAARRANWITQTWRWSAKGKSFLNVESHNIVVFPGKRHSGYWGYKVDSQWGNSEYPTEEGAKLAAFDDFWRLIEPYSQSIVIRRPGR